MQMDVAEALRAIQFSIRDGKEFKLQLEAADSEKNLLADVLETEKACFQKEYTRLKEELEREREMIREMGRIQAAMEDEIRKLHTDKEVAEMKCAEMTKEAEGALKNKCRAEKLVATHRRACERRSPDPKMICYYWALWCSVTKHRMYAQRVQENALNRYLHWKSERILRLAYRQWRTTLALARHRVEFFSRLRRRDLFRALVYWKMVTLRHQSSLRHFHLISQQFLNRVLQAWVHFARRNRETRSHHESRFIVSQRHLKRAFFLRWQSGIGASVEKRNLAFLRIILAYKDRARKHRTFREWGPECFLRKRLLAKTNARLLNNFAMCLAWRRFSTNLSIIDGRKKLAARLPLAAHWRLVRETLRAWRGSFIAEYDIRAYFNEWRATGLRTKLATNMTQLRQMHAYLKQRDEDVKIRDTQFKQVLRQKEEALMNRDQARKMLRDQVEDAQKWTYNCNQFQRKSMELETENGALKEEIKDLKSTLERIEEVQKRFSRKCAACTKDSFCSAHVVNRRPLSARRAPSKMGATSRTPSTEGGTTEQPSRGRVSETGPTLGRPRSAMARAYGAPARR